MTRFWTAAYNVTEIRVGRLKVAGLAVRNSVVSSEQVQTVLSSLNEVRGCPTCGTAIRFGDYDCPHCGLDLEDHLWDWAARLVDSLSSDNEAQAT